MYQSPVLEGPAELYEAPLLLDIDDAVSGICVTGGGCSGDGDTELELDV